MEKTNLNSYELLAQINRMANEEFSKELLFITYFLKKNPYNDDLEDIKHYWFDSDNFIDDWRLAINSLYDYSEKRDNIFHDLIIDAEKILTFYLDGHLRDIRDFSSIVKNFVNSVTVEELRDILSKYLNDDRSREMIATSSSVVELTKRLLSINHDESVLDLCSGKGKFLSSINESDDLTGIEINNDSLKDSFLSCLLNDKHPVLCHQDALTYSGKEFDKIFCEYPWGYIYNRPLQSLGCEKWKPLSIKDLKRSMTSWLFIAKVL